MLFDIGMGILLAFVTDEIFAFPANSSVLAILVALGVAFLLSMDLDAIIDFIIHRGAAHSYRHRDLFHRPIVYISLGILVFGFATYGATPQYTVPIIFLFTVCSLVHCIHDSIGIGWGVQWLWPFSSDHFSFFYQYNAHRGGLPAKIVYVWKDADIDRLEAKYGDKNWFRKIYLSFHPYGLVELAVFVLAVILFFKIV